MDLAFRASFLGAWFTRHTISKGRVRESEHEFDVSKLSRYHHLVHPEEAHMLHSHPLADWFEILRDHTGCHSLSPPPLIPCVSYGGTIMHALSCVLVGSELYWHALSFSVLQTLSEPSTRDRYASLLPGGSQEFDAVVSGIRLDGVPAPGQEVQYHPLLLSIAASILRRVIVLLDPWLPRGSHHLPWPPTAGDFEPWADGGDDAAMADALPPLCLAWETSGRSGREHRMQRAARVGSCHRKTPRSV